MANIQGVVTDRHDYRDQKLFNPNHPKADRKGHVMGLLCRNCRRAHYPDTQGAPELRGCLAGIKVQNVGKSRGGDYLEQEMRLRSEAEVVPAHERPQVENGPPLTRDQFMRLRDHVLEKEGRS
jgi:hypothetical protein